MLSEPPGADPHAGWCGRGQGEPGPYPIRWGAGGDQRQSATPRDARRLPPTRPSSLSSNARVEAINTQIRLITRRAFGFHSADALIALAMLTLAGLCPPLPR